jgi:hypothetical protein
MQERGDAFFDLLDTARLFMALLLSATGPSCCRNVDSATPKRGPAQMAEAGDFSIIM